MKVYETVGHFKAAKISVPVIITKEELLGAVLLVISDGLKPTRTTVMKRLRLEVAEYGLNCLCYAYDNIIEDEENPTAIRDRAIAELDRLFPEFK